MVSSRHYMIVPAHCDITTSVLLEVYTTTVLWDYSIQAFERQRFTILRFRMTQLWYIAITILEYRNVRLVILYTSRIRILYYHPNVFIHIYRYYCNLTTLKYWSAKTPESTILSIFYYSLLYMYITIAFIYLSNCILRR